MGIFLSLAKIAHALNILLIEDFMEGEFTTVCRTIGWKSVAAELFFIRRCQNFLINSATCEQCMYSVSNGKTDRQGAQETCIIQEVGLRL